MRAPAPNRTHASAAALPQPSAADPSIAGSVRDAAGRPLQGARVCAACVFPECPAGPGPANCDTSAPDGRYALRELLPGRYLVGASALGHLPAPTRVAAAVRGKLDYRGRPLREVDIVLASGGVRVSGSVHDASGGPIVDARVQAVAAPPAEPQLHVARSDIDGRFELSVEPGTELVLRAQAAGYASAQSSVLAPQDELRILLTPASRVRGRVISAVDAAAVSGVELRASQLMPHVLIEGSGSARSNERGEFLIEDLSSGRFHLTARSAEWLERQPIAVDLGVGDEVSGITVEVQPAVTVEGTVLDARDRPCTPGSATLSALGAAGPAAFAVGSQIDEAGRVRFDGVPPGEFTVQVTCAQAAPRSYPPLNVGRASLRDLEFRVESALSLEGRVTDPAGRGLSRRVRIEPASVSTAAVSGRELRSDRDGRFTIGGLAAGSYRLSAGERDEASLEIDVTERTHEPIALVLAPGASLRVHVRGAEPDAASTTIRVRDPRSGASLPGQRQPDGSFLTGDLAAGTYEVSVSDGRNAPVLVERDVPATGELTVQVSLPSYAGRLKGRVVDRAGGPVDDAWVDALPDEAPTFGGHRPVLTAVDGTFEIANLAPHGTFTLEAYRARGGQARSHGVRVGQHVVLVLEEERANE